MKKNEQLFYLIKSLSQNEKRNFKVMAAGNGSDSNYLKLFEAIADQDQYDEEKIRSKFKGESFLKQLHTTKNYLRALILKSLRQTNGDKSVGITVRSLISNIEILYSRALFKPCLEEVKKAFKLCETYQLDSLMIEVLNWKRKLLQATQSGDYETLHAVMKEERSVTNRLTNTLSQKELMLEISRADFGQPVDNSILDQLSELGSQEQSFQAHIQYLNSVYHTHIISGDSEAAENTLSSMAKYFDQNEHMARNDPGLYIASLNNAIAFYVFNKNIPRAKELIRNTIQKCKDWGIRNRNKIAFRQLLRTYSIELEIYRDAVEEEKDDSIVVQIEGLMQEAEEAISEEYQVLFRFQLASIYFRSKNYSRSLYWINEHLNRRVQPNRMDLEVYMRILNLLIHYELGNLFVLGYSIDSTRRFLKKYNASEQWILELLRTFGSVRNSPESEIKAIFEKLYLQLFPKGEEATVSDDTLDLINIKNWLYSKVYYPSSVRVGGMLKE